MNPDIELVARCVGVIAREYGLDNEQTQSLARIVKATVDTYAPEALQDNQ